MNDTLPRGKGDKCFKQFLHTVCVAVGDPTMQQLVGTLMWHPCLMCTKLYNLTFGTAHTTCFNTTHTSGLPNQISHLTSPVVCSPITTQCPSASARLASSAMLGTFMLILKRSKEEETEYVQESSAYAHYVLTHQYKHSHTHTPNQSCLKNRWCVAQNAFHTLGLPAAPVRCRAVSKETFSSAL